MKKILFFNLLLLGTGLIMMSFVRVLPVYIIFCFICGFGTMSIMPICNTIIQTVSVTEMRGRVIGFFAMAALGTLPLGSLVIGWLSKYISAQHCQLGQGILCLTIVLLFYNFLRSEKKFNPNETMIDVEDREEVLLTK